MSRGFEPPPPNLPVSCCLFVLFFLRLLFTTRQTLLRYCTLDTDRTLPMNRSRGGAVGLNRVTRQKICFVLSYLGNQKNQGAEQ